MTVPQPFQYQGSQRALAPFILQYLPISTTRLVDSRHDEAMSLERELRGGGGRDQAGRIAHAGKIMAAKFPVQGARYPEHFQKLVGR